MRRDLILQTVGRTVGRRAFLGGAGAALCLGPAVALAEDAPVRDGDVVGRLTIHVAKYEDTLVALARQYDLGFTEIVAANPDLDHWIPGKGARVLLPTQHVLPQADRKGLVINLADQRLYRFGDDGKFLESMPIGIGSEGWSTPTGQTTVYDKRENPSWTVPESIRAQNPELPAVVPAGPNNPLGTRAIRLAWMDYLIHGTNKPWGVGRLVSHGCIRLYPEDIKAVYPKIAIGTPVSIVNQPIKLGWSSGMLMLEAHPNLDQAIALERGDPMTPARPPELIYRVVEAAGELRGRIDWQRVHKTVRERRGVPVGILKLKDTTASLP